MEVSSTENYLRNIILNTKKPIIIRNKIKSDIISWDLHHWNKIIKDESLTFRCGKNKYTQVFIILILFFIKRNNIMVVIGTTMGKCYFHKNSNISRVFKSIQF